MVSSMVASQSVAAEGKGDRMLLAKAVERSAVVAALRSARECAHAATALAHLAGEGAWVRLARSAECSLRSALALAEIQGTQSGEGKRSRRRRARASPTASTCDDTSASEGKPCSNVPELFGISRRTRQE
ncbi:hypothetical protein N9L68_03485 [bacterium]|nr:hypothetical protein [bacterium]